MASSNCHKISLASRKFSIRTSITVICALLCGLCLPKPPVFDISIHQNQEIFSIQTFATVEHLSLSPLWCSCLSQGYNNHITFAAYVISFHLVKKNANMCRFSRFIEQFDTAQTVDTHSLIIWFCHHTSAIGHTCPSPEYQSLVLTRLLNKKRKDKLKKHNTEAGNCKIFCAWTLLTRRYGPRSEPWVRS